MASIVSVHPFVPETFIDARGLAAELDYPEDRLESRTGFLKLARETSERPAIALASGAVEAALSADANLRDSVELIICVTQTPDRPIPHLSAEIHGMFDFRPECTTFDLSLGCSGYVQALDIASALMRGSSESKALLVTADPYSRITRMDDPTTALIFGDAGTCTVLANQGAYSIGQAVNRTYGSKCEALRVDDDRLVMDGRAVYTLAAAQAPQLIRDIIHLNELSLKDIDVFLVHQGSRAIVDAIQQRLGVPADRLPFPSMMVGNTVSSSIPLALAEVLEQSMPNRIVLCGFGVGLAASSLLLTRRPDAVDA